MSAEHNNQAEPSEIESLSDLLALQSRERGPTDKDVLGFVPLTSAESNRANHLYQAHLSDKKYGPARYLAHIARNPKGGRGRASASVFRDEIISPYLEALDHQAKLEKAAIHVPELGANLFEDDGYEDGARDVVAAYVKARQTMHGIPRNKQVSLRELMIDADVESVANLIEEALSNEYLRQNFWHHIIDTVRDRFPTPLGKMADEAEIPRFGTTATGDVAETPYRRGTLQDPEVQEAIRRADGYSRRDTN